MSLIGNVVLSLIAFIVLPVWCIMQIKMNKNHKILSYDFSNSIKGVCAIMISLHHYAQYVDVNKINFLLSRIGFLCVAFFFVMSGYGLTIGYKKKGLDDYLFKRITKIYIPFVIANLLTSVLYAICMESDVSILSAIETSFTMRTIYDNTILWYVFVQLLMYVFFYICFNNKKSEKFKCILLLILCYMYVFYCVINNISEWRYNTVLCFPFGVIVGMYRDNIEQFLWNKKVKILSVCGVSLIGCFFFIYTDRFNILMKIVGSLFFAVILLTLSVIIDIRSKILTFVGNLSYEYYILQFPIIFIVKNNVKIDYLHPFLVIICTIIFAYVTNEMANIVIKKIKKITKKSLKQLNSI